METNKKVSFPKQLAAMVVISLTVGGIIYALTYDERRPLPLVSSTNTEVEEEIKYGDDVELKLSHEDNTCTFIESRYFDETITVSYPEKIDEVAGRWIADENRIQLMQPGGLDIGTVAHEVSHAVDTILVRRADLKLDHHYEAYLQGVLTSCVANILNQDLEEAGLNRFGW